MPHVETKDGTSLFYNDWGSGTPVVLIHGWPLNADMWEYQACTLASSGLRVIAYDRRGFGRSDQPWSGYDYDTLADDLAAVMDHLDLRGAVLVGFSMGGGEVARYLSRHGAGRVAKAVLVSCVTPMLLRTEDHPEGVDRSVFDSIVAGLKKDRPTFLATFGKAFFGAGLLNFTVTDGILEWSRGMALQASPKATLDCVRAFSETDFRPDMKAFTVPTLVIHGDADATVPPDITGKAAAASIPGAKLLMYPGAPHGLFFTEKDRLTADLTAFIAG
jgi:non-heme chloroperoxidase